MDICEFSDQSVDDSNGCAHAVVIGRRSDGGRVLIWEVQKRKETPGALSLSLSTEINCTATNSP